MGPVHDQLVKSSAADLSTSTRRMPQQGRVVIITGANSGLGFAAASALAGQGAAVVLACRSAVNAEQARQNLLIRHSTADLRVAQLDVSDLASVRAFAEAALRDHPRIDVLINNAGIMATPRATSRDGFEMQLATNHLGHFALTGLLLPRLLSTPGSRVVPVASIAARSGIIDFDDLMGQRRYDPWKAYNQSKLANLMFGRELQRRLSAVRAGTIAVVAHPGASTTNLFNTPGGVFVKRIMSPLMRWMFQPPEQGALPILFAATDPAAAPGGYYGPRGFQEMKGLPGPAFVAEQAQDTEVARKLWDVSEQATGVHFLD